MLVVALINKDTIKTQYRNKDTINEVRWKEGHNVIRSVKDAITLCPKQILNMNLQPKPLRLLVLVLRLLVLLFRLLPIILIRLQLVVQLILL